MYTQAYDTVMHRARMSCSLFLGYSESIRCFLPCCLFWEGSSCQICVPLLELTFQWYETPHVPPSVPTTFYYQATAFIQLLAAACVPWWQPLRHTDHSGTVGVTPSAHVGARRCSRVYPKRRSPPCHIPWAKRPMGGFACHGMEIKRWVYCNFISYMCVKLYVYEHKS